MSASPPRAFYLGRYNCIERLGEGPLGETYRAKIYGAAGFERQFAVKRLHAELCADEPRIDELVRAATASAGLENERIPRVQEVNTQGGRYFIVTDLVPGNDVAQLGAALRQRGEPLPLDLALFIASELAQALTYAHGRTDLLSSGVLHLALSPGAALVTVEGRVRLLDIGLWAARRLLPFAPSDPAPDQLAYVAPEVLLGEVVDARADVFSLGALLYRLIAEKPPFVGARVMDLLEAMRNGPALDTLELRVRTVIGRALAHDPAGRFNSIRAFDQALRALAGPRERSSSELFALARRISHSPQPRPLAIPPSPSPRPGRPPPPPPARPAELALEDADVLEITEPIPLLEEETIPFRKEQAATMSMLAGEPDDAVESVADDDGEEKTLPAGAPAGHSAEPFVAEPPLPTEPALPIEQPPSESLPTETALPIEQSPSEPLATEKMLFAEPPPEQAGATAAEPAPSVGQPIPLPPRLPRASAAKRSGIPTLALALAVVAIAAGAFYYLSAPRSTGTTMAAAAPGTPTRPKTARAQPPVAPAAVAGAPVAPAPVATTRVATTPVATARAPQPSPLLMAAAAAPGAAPSASERTVAITSTPPGALIFLDGDRRGTTPAHVDLAAGAHRLVLLADGMQRWRGTIQTAPGSRIDETLEPVHATSGPAGLKVRCHTQGELRIFVDGIDSGRQCPNDEHIALAPGPHRIGLYSPRTDKTAELTADVTLSHHSTRIYTRF